jgi:streptomycin 6-kinase
VESVDTMASKAIVREDVRVRVPPAALGRSDGSRSLPRVEHGATSLRLLALRGALRGPVPVPDGLSWWAGVPGGAAWLDTLPRLVEGCVHDWSLTLGMPFAPGSIAWVAPAELPDGTRAVLKLNFPEAESEHEANALAFWGGVGAARLLAHDANRRALLLARCEPGEQLWSVEDEDTAYGLAAGVFRRLWRPAPPDGPFITLEEQALRWAEELPMRWAHHGRPFPRRLLETATHLSAELARSQPEQVLCHQDAHGGNMLSAGGRWLAIDPKPLVGERAFDLASSLRDRRWALLASPEPERILARRLDRLVSELGVERSRVRGWGIVHALAWAMTDETVYPELIACAELLAHGRL